MIGQFRREQGVALLAATLAIALLLGLGAGLIVVTSAETAIGGNYRTSSEALYAASAVVEQTIGELRDVADWDQVLAGATRSAFVDGAPGGSRTLPDGSPLAFAEVLSLANCFRRAPCTETQMNATTERRPWGVNNPRWTLYAHGTLDDLVGAPTQGSAFYVVAMVADDGGENDGDPLRDGSSVGPPNPGRHVIALRGEAFGPRGAHRAIEVVISRYRTDESDPASAIRVRVHTWKAL